MKPESPTIAIATLGCKTNQFESAAMTERLRAAGYEVVDFGAGADLVVVNTCTVTAATDAQSRNVIRRARRLNPGCRVVVTGCYAQIEPQSLREIPGVSLVLGNDEKRDLVRLLETEGVHVGKRPQARIEEGGLLASYSGRSRAFLQIQNGCDAFCSYCIIPAARGRSRSAPAAQVLDQVRNLAGEGYPEVVLTGIHIGGYGADLEPETSLLELVRRIEVQTLVGRLRLGSIEPTEISEALIETVADSRVVCPHFHIPLQAGDDDILRQMNRHYSTGFFRDLVQRIRSRLPGAAIGLDVIAGFPGETDALFENTFRFIDSLPVTHLHVFPYSRRPGTPAAGMAGQVPGDLVRARAARLRELGERKTAEYAAGFAGRELEVVVEGGPKGGLYQGITRSYMTVRFPGPKGMEGQVVKVKIEAAEKGGLRGRLS